MADTLPIRLAGNGDFHTIIGLFDEASRWLRTKETDQWRKPWPNRKARDNRVLRGLRDRRTWLVEDRLGGPVATITVREHGSHKLWTAEERAVSAVYVCRLVVGRAYSGQGIGEALIDWAGLRGLRKWSAQCIRIDVWTTNVALHTYYEKRGFRFCRVSELPGGEYYPSAALFSKPISLIDPAAASRFTESPLTAPHAGPVPPAARRARRKAILHKIR